MMVGITPRMLTLQLRELEREGFVRRSVRNSLSPHVDYELTEFGRTLEPVLLAVRDWGRLHGDRLASAYESAAEAS